MKKILLLTALAFAALSTAGARAETKEPEAAAPAPAAPELRTLFDDLEASFRKRDADLFRKHILPAGWRKNFTGGSGTNLKKLFEQGARKKWFLKPDLDRVERAGDKALVVPCAVFSWRKGRAMQRAFVVVGKHEERYVLVGGGKRHAEVTALAERYQRGDALVEPDWRGQRKKEGAPPPAP